MILDCLPVNNFYELSADFNNFFSPYFLILYSKCIVEGV